MKFIKKTGILKRLFAMAAFAVTFQVPAHACGNTMCDWKLCFSNAWPFLSVSNDTRANLVLLATEHNKNLKSPFFVPNTDLRSTQPFTLSEEDNRSSANIDDTLFRQFALLKLDDYISPNRKMDTDDNYINNHTISNNSVTLSRFFQTLLDDSTLSAEQRTILARERLTLFHLQREDESTLARAQTQFPVKSHAADLENYLFAAYAFYQGAFDAAEQRFQSLTQAKQGWVAETAAYMLIRTSLNRGASSAQQDEYGFIDTSKSDQTILAQGVAHVKDYLKRFPQGLYAHSAQGLLRRLAVFSPDRKGLDKSVEWSLKTVDNLSDLHDLVQEADRYMLLVPPRWEEDHRVVPKTPMLTMVRVLAQLRSNNDYPDPSTTDKVESSSFRSDNSPYPALTESEITGYRPMFEEAGRLADWDYLHLAWLFHAKKDYAAVVAAVEPASEEQLQNIAIFSQQVLKGVALRALGALRDEENHWHRLLSLKTDYTQQQFLQMMLANALAIQGKTQEVFVPGSPVTNPRFRSFALKKHADLPLLQQQVISAPSNEERVIALHTLLIKSLLEGNYNAYLNGKELKNRLFGQESYADSARDSDINLSTFNWEGEKTDYPCESLDRTAATLVHDPRDAHALNCLGDFFRLTNAHVDTQVEAQMQWHYRWQWQNWPYDYWILENGQSLIAYQKVIDSSLAKPEDASYALYKAINCFFLGRNRCGEQEVDVSVRKAWFKRLKTQYKTTQWAKLARYYW